MIKRLWQNYRFRVSLMTFAVTCVSLLGLVILLDWGIVGYIRSAVERSLQIDAEGLVNALGNADRDAMVTANNLSRHPAVVDGDNQQMSLIFNAIAQSNVDLESIRLVATNGDLLLGSEGTANFQSKDQRWLRDIMMARPTREALMGSDGKMPVELCGAPVRNAKNQIVAMLGVSFIPQKIASQLPTSDLGQTGYRLVLDDENRVIVHRDMQLVQQFSLLEDMPGLRHGAEEDGLAYVRDKDGVDWVCYSQHTNNNWTVVSLEQEGEILAQVQHVREFEFLAVLICAALTAVAKWFLAARFTRPIAKLADFCDVVGKGRLDVRADEKEPGEIGRLAGSLNFMIAKIERGYREIEGKVERRTQTLKLRNAELIRANQLSKRENEIKDEFLANMGHEIRTPLTAILGYSELLVDLQMSEEERSKALQSIQYNGQHLLSIINNVLDIAKLDANKMEVEKSDFPIVALINDVITLMRAKAIEKNIALEVEFANDLPESVTTDPTRLRQILLNLVGNAIKYTHQGTVRLIARVIEPSGDSPDGFMQFEVIDSGIGLSEEHMAKLFKPFSQATGSTAAHYGGTGLGLVISQRLARLLGGDITVKSNFGEGSNFTLTVNIGTLRGKRMSKATAALHDSVAAIPFVDDQLANELVGVRVLLADDNPANLELISKILSTSGAEVSTSSSGRRACHEAMEAFQAGRPFNVVVLDMQMPELDGAGSTARLRQLGYPGPIIVLSSIVGAKDTDRCVKAGCSEVVRKPVTRDKLINIVSKYSGRQRAHRRPGEGSWFGNVA